MGAFGFSINSWIPRNLLSEPNPTKFDPLGGATRGVIAAKLKVSKRAIVARSDFSLRYRVGQK